MLSVSTYDVSSNHLWRGITLSIVGFVVLAATLASTAATADNPAQVLQSEVESARRSLAAGDAASAEAHYINAVTLGLRQAAQLSVVDGRIDQAAAYLDDSLNLKPDDPDTQVAAADVWFREGDSGKAEAALKSLVAKDPNNLRARNLLGRIYVFDDDADDAIEQLKAAQNLQDDFETSYFLGIAYLKARKLEEGTGLFRQLESKMGESAALHVLFGRAYLIAKLSQQAIPEFSKAIKLDSKYPRAHSFLGYAYLEYYQEEGYPRARQEFEQELKLNPNDYHSLELLGIADVNLRDFAAAETALLRATRLRPRDASPYLYLGEAYAATNRVQLAVEALKKYTTLIGNPEQENLREASRAYYLLGQNLRRLGQEQEARAALARSQQIRETKFKYDVKHIFDEKKNPQEAGESRVSDPVADLLGKGSAEQNSQAMIQEGVATEHLVKQPPPGKETSAAKQYRSFVAEIIGSSYNDLGVMRAKESRFSEAAEFFRQAASWRSDLAGLDRNWGLASFRAERYPEAVAPLERQLAAHPNDSFVRQLLGLSYSMLEKDEKVVEVFRPFLEHPPDDPGLLLAWGTALVHLHQSGTAADIFRRMLEQNAENPSVHLLLGKAYAQQQDYPSALNEFSSALKLNPRLPEAHYYAGLAHLQQNEFESAAREFRAELDLRPSDPQTMYHLGYALLLQGELTESIAVLREVIKATPNNELAHFELGRALLQQGDVGGAIASLETAKKLAPEHDAAYFQLSQAYRRAGRMQEAGQELALYQKLIEANRQKKRKLLETDKP